MKLYLEAKPEPWITWDKDLWKASQNISRKTSDFTITSMEQDADVIMLEYYPELEYRFSSDQRYVLYIESIEGWQCQDMIEKWLPVIKNVTFVSDSVEVIAMFDNFTEGNNNIVCHRWNRPTRVPPRQLYTGDLDCMAKDGGFVITSNASRVEDNMTEILRTYFAMCLQDDDTNEGELKLMHDVDIYSAQELPFETFNNIHFHGLQPNPSMFKMIKNAKLFISPYRGDGVPINAIDAVMLGTPVIVRDTPANRAVFNWNEKCFYKNEEELAKKIKFFSEISYTDQEYLRIVNDGFDAVRQSHSVSNSLSSLIHILQEI